MFNTCGLTICAKAKHTDPRGQATLSKGAELNLAGYDTIGVCIFAGFGFATNPATLDALVNSRYGTDYGEDILQELGKEILDYKRKFNRLAGFTKADDRLPELT